MRDCLIPQSVRIAHSQLPLQGSLYCHFATFPTPWGITLFEGAFYGVRFAAFTYYSKQKILRLNRVFLRQFCFKITSLCINPPDMPELIWGDTFSCIKIYHFEVLCSFVAIEFLCRSQETEQDCRLARLFDKSIRDFYTRTRYFLMNAQPPRQDF